MKREKLNVPLFKMSIQILHTLLVFFNKYDKMQLRNSFLTEEIEGVSKKATLLFQNTQFLAQYLIKMIRCVLHGCLGRSFC